MKLLTNVFTCDSCCLLVSPVVYLISSCLLLLQLQRFLQRNRKDRKTRRKKGQTEATKAEKSPQSNKEAQESGPGVGASTFVPFSAVLGTRPSKVPRQDSNQSDARLGAGSGTKENGVTSRADNLFQPELFNSILSDLTTYGRF